MIEYTRRNPENLKIVEGIYDKSTITTNHLRSEGRGSLEMSGRCFCESLITPGWGKFEREWKLYFHFNCLYVIFLKIELLESEKGARCLPFTSAVQQVTEKSARWKRISPSGILQFIFCSFSKHFGFISLAKGSNEISGWKQIENKSTRITREAENQYF